MLHPNPRSTVGGPRGNVGDPDDSFASVCAARAPLYERYCKLIEDVDSDNSETIAEWILQRA